MAKCRLQAESKWEWSIGPVVLTPVIKGRAQKRTGIKANRLKIVLKIQHTISYGFCED